jgi:hypothetical protein
MRCSAALSSRATRLLLGHQTKDRVPEKSALSYMNQPTAPCAWSDHQTKTHVGGARRALHSTTGRFSKTRLTAQCRPPRRS